MMTNKVVMVVSEDRQVRRLVASILRQAGFEVVEAGNGRETMNAAEWDRVDLLVTDVLSRKSSGPEVVRRLHARRPDLKALYLVDRHAARTDTDTYLHKPFFVDELADAVTASVFGRCRCPSCQRSSGLAID